MRDFRLRETISALTGLGRITSPGLNIFRRKRSALLAAKHGYTRTDHYFPSDLATYVSTRNKRLISFPSNSHPS